MCVWCVCGCDCSCVYMCVVVGGCILVVVCPHVEVNVGCHSSGAIHLAFPDNLSLVWSVPSGRKSGWPMKPRNTLPQHWDHKQIPHAQLFTRVLGTECKPSYWQGKHYQGNIVPVQRLLGSSGIRLYKVLMCDVSLDSIYW